MPLLFCCQRCQVTDGAVQTLPIVEDLDVVEDAGLGLLPGCVAMVVDPFSFEQCEEALQGRIVVTVAGTAHAHAYLRLGKQRLVVGACVLAATV